MTATKKQMCAKTAMALEEAKAIRAKQYEHKDKRIRIMKSLGVSHKYIQKVLARAGGKP